jgi:hypothetical protein
MSLKQVTDRVNLVHNVLETVMKQNTHYGTVPGCGTKMVLLKPGADVLAMTFRLVPQFAVTRTDLENGHREYDVTCSMHGPGGELLGQGVGSASTMEKKYRYRWDSEGRDRKRIENEDIADCYNTVLKIAKKRAHIDATLTVTGAADLFTQDLIDEEDAPSRQPVEMPTERPAAKSAPVPMSAESVENTVTGLAERVYRKDGKKPCTVYVNDVRYGSFDDGLSEAAAALKGKVVTLTVERVGDYWNFIAIRAAGNTPAPAPADGPQDKLPL